MKFKIILIIFLKIISFKILIKFFLPKNIKVILFDNLSLKQVQNVLGNYKYFLLPGRLVNCHEIYINLEIIIRILKHLNKGLSLAYNLAIIEIINPRIVITTIDNSILFHKISKIIHKYIPTLGVQLSNRPDIIRNEHFFKKKISKKNLNNNIFLDHFFGLSSYDLDFYKKNKISINNPKVSGSLTLANAVLFFKKKKIKIEKNKYDICLISDGFTSKHDKIFGAPGWEKNISIYLKNLIKIIKKNKLKFIFCIKRTKDAYLEEVKFYQKYLEKEEVDFLFANSNERKIDEYISPTYKDMLQSKLTISVWSTLLRENMQLGRKSLCVDVDPNGVYMSPLRGICRILNPNFNKLEKRILYLLSISEKNYVLAIGKKINYFIFPHQHKTIKIIKNSITNIVNRKI